MTLPAELERLRANVHEFCALLIEAEGPLEVRAEFDAQMEAWVFMIRAPEGKTGLGRIIGTEGHTIKALRTLVHAASRRIGADVNLCTYDRAPGQMRRDG